MKSEVKPKRPKNAGGKREEVPVNDEEMECLRRYVLTCPKVISAQRGRERRLFGLGIDFERKGMVADANASFLWNFHWTAFRRKSW